MAEAVIIEKQLHDPTEILQNSVTDFAIMREDPILFRAGSSVVVCMPVKYFDHYEYLKGLLEMINKYHIIFEKLEFLSLSEFRDKSLLSQSMSKLNIISATKEYKDFIGKDIPAFIRRWALTIKTGFFSGRQKFVKIKNVKKVLGNFTADDLIHIFLVLFVFNFDVVKKNLFDLCGRLISRTSSDKQISTISSSSTKSKGSPMPPYSERAFSNETWQLLDEQRKQ